MQLHKLKKDESRTYDVPPVHLTPAGIEKLHEELVRLRKRLPIAADEAARTAAYGDRSDNAEYKQAKGALRGMHRRIFEIETKLRNAVAIPKGPSPAGTIRLGSTVVLQSIAKLDAAAKTYEIVGPAETDPTHGRISDQSPLGSALIGCSKGDEVKGYKVVDIR